MLLRSSLGGKCVTNVIVCVSPEQQHEDESKCTLRFGQRMTGVSNRGVINKTIDVDTERKLMERQLKQLKRELKGLDARGQGSTTGKSSNIAANKLILENIAKLEKMEAKLQSLRDAFVEAKYKGDQQEISKLKDAIETFSQRTLNHSDVVLRQKTIKGLHVDSSKAYKQKEAEISELEGKLRMLGGGNDNKRYARK